MAKENLVKAKGRGIALISVFIVSGILMILLGGFITVNKRNFDLLHNDLQHLDASQAARSAFDYCVFQLERDRTWGAARFSPGKDPAGDPSEELGDYLDVKRIGNSHTIEGHVVDGGATFKVDILNNIDGTATVDGVKKGDCRLRISSSAGLAHLNREAVLATAPLFDGSIISNKRIKIDAEKLFLSSTDPLRNRVRAKGSIQVPNYAKDGLDFLEGPKTTERGVLWAKNGIKSGNHSLSDPDTLRDAQAKTGGMFFPSADTFYDIYDLQLDEVRSNSKRKDGTLIEPSHLDSGVYVFARKKVTYSSSTSSSGYAETRIPVLERRDWTLDVDGNLVKDADVKEVWYLPSSLPDDATDWRVALWGDLPESGIHALSKGEFELDGGVKVAFNALEDLEGGTDETDATNGNKNWKGAPTITIDTSKNLVVDGDFGVASEDPLFRPNVKFQSSTGSEAKDGVETGTITALKSGSGRGSIYLEGNIEGNGKLLAQGDVTLKNTFANVSSDTKSDLSVYAGGSVTIRPQKPKLLDDVTEFQDWKKNLEGATAFRGLVFAQQDVKIEADKSNGNGPVDKASIYIEGAVVARKGSVEIDRAQWVHFRYNPDYLDTILNPKIESRVRLERVVWKEY